MPKRRTHFTPHETARIEDAWSALAAARRRVAVLAPNAERRYLQTQDLQRYSHEARRVTQLAASAIRRFRQACRDVIRPAEVVPLGTTLVGIPWCVLVRVPNGTVTAVEMMLGKPRAHDADAKATIEQMEAHAKHERTRECGQHRIATMKEKMTYHLGCARRLDARVQSVKTLRRMISRGELAAYQLGEEAFLRTRQYGHAQEGRRHMVLAIKARDRLRDAGMQYDLASLATPLAALSDEEDYMKARGTEAYAREMRMHMLLRDQKGGPGRLSRLERAALEQAVMKGPA